MKKIFVFFMSLMFIMCLAGCGEIKDGELMSFIETDNNYLIEPNCLSNIIKIEVYNSSLEKIEEITDISVINVYISEIKKHIFDRVIMIEDVTTSGKSMEETVPKVKGAADVEIVGLMVSLNRMEKGLGGEKSALEEIREKYGFQANAIVSMADVVEYLYNKPYKGQVYIDDTLKAAIDAYYEVYGA